MNTGTLGWHSAIYGYVFFGLFVDPCMLLRIANAVYDENFGVPMRLT